MWKNSSVFLEDMERFSELETIPWERLKGKTILITGATGLIGYTLVCALLFASEKRKLNLKVLAIVRNIRAAEEKFRELLLDRCNLCLVEGTMEEIPHFDEPIDYIVHGASRTASKDFVESPVEVLKTALGGTVGMLELAKEKQVDGMIYLSSMEVYGYPKRGDIIKEDDIGTFSPTHIRNCYPIGKLASESLCCSYASEYGVPVRILRLAQTFGPGVAYHEKRVFADFARCIIAHKNIVLKTKGESEHCYLYTMDAASAIVIALLCGNSGEAYTAANEQTYCSIAKMAELAAVMANTKVEYVIESSGSNGYANTHYLKLDTQKLQMLGWTPVYLLPEMYSRMVECYKPYFLEKSNTEEM